MIIRSGVVWRHMGRVLVLDTEEIHGVVAIRCLGARDVSVTAGSSERWNGGRLSKYADRYVTYPPVESDPDEFVRTVLREVETGEYDMVLPIIEQTVQTVIENRSRFEKHTCVPFPPNEQMRVGLDKRRTIEAAREYDIPHPKTLFSAGTDLDTVEEELGYPVVVKPERGEGRVGVSVCHSRENLQRAFRQNREERGPVLFQEFVPHGGERGVYTLYDRSGELTALTVQRRIRSHPPEGGASTYRETVEDPALVELTDQLLSELDWRGVAMAEFRIDSRTDEPKLLEINPRLWGSLVLSVAAGRNFPYLLYRLAVGDDIEPDLEYDVGIRARSLFTDGLQLIEREDRLRALREFFAPEQNPCCYDIASVRDPLPMFGMVAYGISRFHDRRSSVIR